MQYIWHYVCSGIELVLPSPISITLIDSLITVIYFSSHEPNGKSFYSLEG